MISREILPVARDHGIVLAVENVWNGFLLGPIDFAHYLDGFDSPWVRACLDVGNVMFGRPEGWIDILGDRICKLHLKDLRLRLGKGRFRRAKIGSGDVDWTKVRAALARSGYSGWAVLAEPDEALAPAARQIYLRTVRRRTLAPFSALNPLLGPVQTRLARRLLNDVIDRFQRHIAD